MKRDLIIIGSYPNTKLSEEVLIKCISSLKDKFDIALATHYPVDKEIQNLVDYYIYDSYNHLI
jgi:hypothetical protein